MFLYASPFSGQLEQPLGRMDKLVLKGQLGKDTADGHVFFFRVLWFVGRRDTWSVFFSSFMETYCIFLISFFFFRLKVTNIHG